VKGVYHRPATNVHLSQPAVVRERGRGEVEQHVHKRRNHLAHAQAHTIMRERGAGWETERGAEDSRRAHTPLRRPLPFARDSVWAGWACHVHTPVGCHQLQGCSRPKAAARLVLGVSAGCHQLQGCSRPKAAARLVLGVSAGCHQLQGCSRPKAAARLVLGVSAGWASPSARGLCGEPRSAALHRPCWKPKP
jgi:hypothetical protein